MSLFARAQNIAYVDSRYILENIPEFTTAQEELNNLKNKGCEKLFVVPLYPHNAMATTLTTKIEVKRVAKEIFDDLEIIFIDNISFINEIMKITSANIGDSIFLCLWKNQRG